MSTNQMFEHKIHLTKQMKDRLQSGGAVRIRATAINHVKGKPLRVFQGNHQRLLDGYQNKRMAEVLLSPEEITANHSQGGTGFFRTMHKLGVSKKQMKRAGHTVLKGLESGAKMVAKEAIPLIAKTGVTAGLTALTGNPMIGAISGQVVGNIAKEQVKRIGSGLKVKNGCGLDKKLMSKINRGTTIIKHQFGGSVNIGPDVTNRLDSSNIHNGLLAVSNVLNNDHPARNPFVPPVHGHLMMVTNGNGLYAPSSRGHGLYAPGH